MNNTMSRDITLKRDHHNVMSPDGTINFQQLNDKRHWDADSKIVEYQKQVYNLQINCHYLQKQLERLVTMNPEMQDLLDKKPADNAAAKLSPE